MAPQCNVALCRRDDTDDSESDAARFRTVVFVSYLLAFLVAAAITTYILAYIQPPQKWKWYCRVRGRPVEPRSPLPASPTNGIFVVDDGGSLKDRSADRAGGGWMRGAVTKLLRRQQPGSEPRNGSVPSNRIRRTAAYVVRHEPALELQPSTSKPVTTISWPLTNSAQSAAEADGSNAEPRVYGGGRLPWK